MCGRYALHTPLEIILHIFQIARTDRVPAPGYNVAPGQEVAVERAFSQRAREHPPAPAAVGGAALDGAE